MINLPGRITLVVSFVLFHFFSALNTSCQSIVVCKISAKKSADIQMGIHLYIISCFTLAAFIYLSLTLDILIKISDEVSSSSLTLCDS